MLTQKVSGRKNFYHRIEKIDELDTSQWEKAYFIPVLNKEKDDGTYILTGVFQDSTSNIFVTSYQPDTPFTEINSILVGTGFNLINPPELPETTIYATNLISGELYRLKFGLNSSNEVEIVQDWRKIDIGDKILLQYCAAVPTGGYHEGETLLMIDSTGFLYYAIYDYNNNNWAKSETLVIDDLIYGSALINRFSGQDCGPIAYGIQNGSNFDYYIKLYSFAGGDTGNESNSILIGSFSNPQNISFHIMDSDKAWCIFEDSILHTFSFAVIRYWWEGDLEIKKSLTPVNTNFRNNLFIENLDSAIILSRCLILGTTSNSKLAYQFLDLEYNEISRVRTTGEICSNIISGIMPQFIGNSTCSYSYLNINQKLLRFDEKREFYFKEISSYNNNIIAEKIGNMILIRVDGPILLPNGNLLILYERMNEDTWEASNLYYILIDSEANIIIPEQDLGQVSDGGWIYSFAASGIGGEFFKFQKIENNKIYINKFEDFYEDFTIFFTKYDVKTRRIVIGIDGTTISDWEIIPEFDGLICYNQTRLSENSYVFALVDPTDDSNMLHYYAIVNKWGNVIRDKVLIGNAGGNFNTIQFSLLPNGDFVMICGIIDDSTGSVSLHFCDSTGDILDTVIVGDGMNEAGFGILQTPGYRLIVSNLDFSSYYINNGWQVQIYDFYKNKIFEKYLKEDYYPYFIDDHNKFFCANHWNAYCVYKNSNLEELGKTYVSNPNMYFSTTGFINLDEGKFLTLGYANLIDPWGFMAGINSIKIFKLFRHND